VIGTVRLLLQIDHRSSVCDGAHPLYGAGRTPTYRSGRRLNGPRGNYWVGAGKSDQLDAEPALKEVQPANEDLYAVTNSDSSWWVQGSPGGEKNQTGKFPQSRAAFDLVGRSAELELIDSLLAGHTLAGRGLLLRGAPGVGKTALLDTAATRAEMAGMRVLRASGAQFEAEIGFSALRQLLYPLRERADRLAAGHRDALRQVFDHASGPPPGTPLDPLVVSTAVLALLAEVAGEHPLLVLVDDVPWIDRASATVLGFAARRISNDSIVFLAATRSQVDSFFDQVRLPEWEVGPLGEQPAATLLDARYPGLAPPVRRRLLAEAAGNPLALRELPASLTDRQRSGQDPLPGSCRFPGGWRSPSPPDCGRCPYPPGNCCYLPRWSLMRAWPPSDRPCRATGTSRAVPTSKAA
jgi:hypothetical protein